MLVASCILSNAYQVWLDMQKPNFWKNLGFPSQEAQTLMRLFPLASMQSRLTTFAYLCISNLLVAFRCWNLEKNSRFLWLPCLMFFFATGILGQALAPSVTGDAFFLNLSSKQWLSHDSIGFSKQLQLDLSQGRCYSAACAANSFWPWRYHPSPALLSLYHIIRACWTSYLVPVSHLKCEKPIWHVTKTKISAWRKWHRHIGLKFHGKICESHQWYPHAYRDGISPSHVYIFPFTSLYSNE